MRDPGTTPSLRVHRLRLSDNKSAHSHSTWALFKRSQRRCCLAMAPKEKTDDKKKEKKVSTSADKGVKEKKPKSSDATKEKKPSSKDKPAKDAGKDGKPLKSSKGAHLRWPHSFSCSRCMCTSGGPTHSEAVAARPARHYSELSPALQKAVNVASRVP